MLHGDTEVTGVDLARHFAVSPTTIRRDLQTLETGGIARRIHGGAIRAVPDAFEPPFPVDLDQDVPAVQAVADAAEALIGDSAERCFGDVNCCVAFVDVAGLDVEPGLGEADAASARVKRAAMDATHRCVVADASRCGRAAPFTVTPPTAVDALLTDAPPADPVVRALTRNGAQVVHIPGQRE